MVFQPRLLFTLPTLECCKQEHRASSPQGSEGEEPDVSNSHPAPSYLIPKRSEVLGSVGVLCICRPPSWSTRGMCWVQNVTQRNSQGQKWEKSSELKGHQLFQQCSRPGGRCWHRWRPSLGSDVAFLCLTAAAPYLWCLLPWCYSTARSLFPTQSKWITGGILVLY